MKQAKRFSSEVASSSAVTSPFRKRPRNDTTIDEAPTGGLQENQNGKMESNAGSSSSFSTGDVADSSSLEEDHHGDLDPNTTRSKPSIDPVLLQHAKSRLSKFAARLFDPNRPKGLIEPPQVIPLNDEFLSAFGKREMDYDKATGRTETYEQEIHSDEDDEDEADQQSSEDQSKKNKNKSEPVLTSDANTKVKITNLAYRTTQETLTNACLQFGSLQEVNMILDREPPAGSDIQNSGRAYVTFETEDGALACMNGLKNLDGRDLRITAAATKIKATKATTGGDGTHATASLLNRMLERDISTVCFRCGKVGHMESSCPNPAKPKPCTLCGILDHDQRACPYNRICFNCGSPGHVNRDCSLPRGLQRRMVCGICFQSGHHRLQCRTRSSDYLPRSVVSHAVCMTCGQKGHFLCKDLEWFYGLRGLSCFNCGAQGHSGYDCQRPTLSHCAKYPEDAVREVEQAEAISIAEALERQMQQRGRSNERGNSNRPSHRSMPPTGERRGGNLQQNFVNHRRDRRGY